MSTTPVRTVRGLLTVAVTTLAGLAAVVGCAGPPQPGPTSISLTPSSSPVAPPTSSTTTTSVPAPTTTAKPAKPAKPRPTKATPRPATTTRKPAPVARPSHSTTPAPRPSTKAAPAGPATCSVPSGVTAPQVVLVNSSGSSATVRACARSGSRYVLQLGPYNGHVGRNGVSWNKHEGDNTTPGGTYALVEGFGNYANPGLRVGSWLQVGAADVWVEDPASAYYNTHQRLPSNGRWGYAESMTTAPAYNYAQVIAYNTANVPGKGSGIFFHVDQGRGTAGCVSLPTSSLLSVLRWERAGVVMSIQ